mmetsp:Transcript_54547/g.118687  ORF Transcript_54547/g.118687 Transcript_54547/m.118687 type:complete len:221 (-) Transcript_54547:607-1269(-)
MSVFSNSPEPITSHQGGRVNRRHFCCLTRGVVICRLPSLPCVLCAGVLGFGGADRVEVEVLELGAVQHKAKTEGSDERGEEETPDKNSVRVVDCVFCEIVGDVCLGQSLRDDERKLPSPHHSPPNLEEILLWFWREYASGNLPADGHRPQRQPFAKRSRVHHRGQRNGKGDRRREEHSREPVRKTLHLTMIHDGCLRNRRKHHTAEECAEEVGSDKGGEV